MSDNTQVTEQDMNAALTVLDNMRNAVIEGSRLRVDFDALKSEFQGLKNDLAYLRERNQTLDEMVASVRKARDEALADAAGLRAELEDTKRALTLANRAFSIAEDDNTKLETRISGMQKENDSLFEELDTVLKERDQFKSKLDAVTTALGLPNPVPTPEQNPPTPPVAAPEVGQGPLESTLNASGPATGEVGGSEKPSQPRDPVTQQWRSPYDEHDPAERNVF